MSIEIRFRNGHENGKTIRVRSLGEQPSQRTFVWKEFCNGKPTGSQRTEIYRLDRDNREYVLLASDSGTSRTRLRAVNQEGE
jgi:hypothetical protein